MGLERDLAELVKRAQKAQNPDNAPRLAAVLKEARMSVLEVKVGGPIESGLAQFGETLEAAMAGNVAAPYFGIGFRNMTQFGEVFTPKRWELVEALKASGPLSIYALAKLLNRHYSNVHQDVSALMEWTVIEKDGEDHVFVPWDEIAVRWPLVN